VNNGDAPVGAFVLSPVVEQVGFDPGDEDLQPPTQLDHGVGFGIGNDLTIQPGNRRSPFELLDRRRDLPSLGLIDATLRER
jgi:hypothetical protein